ncbi:MAG: HEAT repeat domain-containing protein [Actinobacteria bacterium]|nr:MAG: HEAT repeat domain-containing protein [Actinomycetota bacterium]
MTEATAVPTLTPMDRLSGAPELGAAELSDALASAEPAVRSDALDRAGRGPDVLEVVLDALVDPDPEVRRAAVRALVRGDGPRATRALIEVSAGDVSVIVRAEAVAALGRILEAMPPGAEPGSTEPSG